MQANPQKRLLMQLSRSFPDAIFFKETTEKIVALTIDDVPVPNEPTDVSTHLLLDTIANHNQQVVTWRDCVYATFFVITGHLGAKSTVLERICAEGHELGNHGTTDETTATLPADLFTAQFKAAHQILANHTQQPLRWYRPGRGLYNQSMLQTLRTMPGYEPRFALASMLPLDTFKPTHLAPFTVWYASQFVFPGAILVLHGGSAAQAHQTAQVLPILLKILTVQGYRIVTLSELWDAGSTAAAE